MKKHLFLIVFSLTLLSATAWGQVGDRRRDVAIGINGGATMSSMSFTPTIKQGTLLGTTAGLTLKYTCEKYFETIAALQMELNYSQQGWKEEIEDGTENTYHRQVNYVQIPFMAHLGWGREGRGAQVFFNAGPQIAFYVSDSESYGFTEEYPWITSSRPNSVDYQYGKEVECVFDYGICGGLGVELTTKAGHFLLEGRYYYGFGNLFHSTKKDPFGNSNNSVITVKFGYLIDILRTK